MRRLTFKGFLEPYVRYLADRQTSSLVELTRLAQTNLRLREPLMLLAIVTGKYRTMSRQLQNQPRLREELDRLESLRRTGELERALASEESGLRAEYVKVWRSYVARRDAHLRDQNLKLVARQRVLALEKSKSVSRYRMAKDLDLNQGNLHAFLAQGNAQKLSLDRVFALLNYVEAAEHIDPDRRGDVTFA